MRSATAWAAAAGGLVRGGHPGGQAHAEDAVVAVGGRGHERLLEGARGGGRRLGEHVAGLAAGPELLGGEVPAVDELLATEADGQGDDGDAECSAANSAERSHALSVTTRILAMGLLLVVRGHVGPRFVRRRSTGGRGRPPGTPAGGVPSTAGHRAQVAHRGAVGPVVESATERGGDGSPATVAGVRRRPVRTRVRRGVGHLVGVRVDEADRGAAARVAGVLGPARSSGGRRRGPLRRRGSGRPRRPLRPSGGPGGHRARRRCRRRRRRRRPRPGPPGRAGPGPRSAPETLTASTVATAITAVATRTRRSGVVRSSARRARPRGPPPRGGR